MLKRAHILPRKSAPGPRPRPGVWLLMFTVAAALRAGYAWIATGPHAIPFSDPADYDTVAWNLARGLGFALNGAAGPYPTAFVPPTVPWITSLLYGTIGHHYFAAVLLQCVIAGFVPLLLAAFGTAMFGGSAGRLAGWLATFHPLLIFFSGYLLTETAFCAAMLLALTMSAEWVKTPRPGRAFGAGLAWGLASLTRPTALMLPGLVLLWAWVPLGLTITGRDRARQMALLLLGLALAVGPWTLRNALVLHAFIPVTTGAGGALYVSNNEEVWNDPARRGGAVGEGWVKLNGGEFRGLSEPEVDRRARAHAIAFLSAHVREWPAMAAAKLSRFWRVSMEGGGTGAWQRPGSPLSAILRRVDPLLLWSIVVLPFAIYGTGIALRGPRRWFQSLSAWVILYFTVLAIVFFGSLRMRVPIEPLVVLLSALGIEDARRRLRIRARGLRVVEGRRPR